MGKLTNTTTLIHTNIKTGIVESFNMSNLTTTTALSSRYGRKMMLREIKWLVSGYVCVSVCMHGNDEEAWIWTVLFRLLGPH